MHAGGSPVASAITASGWTRPTPWLLATLVVLGAVVRLRGLDFGLPHTQARPDETAIIDQARILLSGRLPHFYDYPWLYIWVVSISYLGYFAWGLALGTFHSLADMHASWPSDWNPVFLIPRALSALFGTASIVVGYRVGRKLAGEATGVVSALFLTFAVLDVRSAHFGTTDVMMTFLILCAIALMIEAHRGGRPAMWAAAGFVAGLAAATKYNAVLLVVPVIVSRAIAVLDAPGRRRDALLDPALSYFAAPFVLAFAIGVPFVLLDWTRFLHAMKELFSALHFGDTRLASQNGWIHHLSVSLRYGLGLPILAAGLAGAVLLLVLEPRIGAVLLSFPLAYYLVAGSFRMAFIRYMLPVDPFLCLTAAYAICRSAAFVAARLPGPPERRVRRLQIVTVVLALALVAPSIRSIRAFDRVIRQTDNRVVLARWFEENVPAGSSVMQSGSRYGLAQFDRRVVFKEWQWDRSRRIFLVDGRRPDPAARPDWIVVQDSPLPSATQGVVTEFLAEGYEHVVDFTAFTPSAQLVYDRQDAFFVPFNGFDRVARPGPNFSVYKRSGVGRDRESRLVSP